MSSSVIFAFIEAEKARFRGSLRSRCAHHLLAERSPDSLGADRDDGTRSKLHHLADPDRPHPSAPASVTTTTVPSPPRPTGPTIPTSPPEVRGTVGQTLTAAGVELRIDDVTFEPCTGQYGEALPGMTFAVVTATLRNVAYNGTVDYGAFAWVMTSADSLLSDRSLRPQQPLDQRRVVRPGLQDHRTRHLTTGVAQCQGNDDESLH